jgi:hypothetical protein
MHTYPRRLARRHFMVSSLYGISRLERPGDEGATLDAKTDVQGQAVLTRPTLLSIGKS